MNTKLLLLAVVFFLCVSMIIPVLLAVHRPFELYHCHQMPFVPTTNKLGFVFNPNDPEEEGEWDSYSSPLAPYVASNLPDPTYFPQPDIALTPLNLFGSKGYERCYQNASRLYDLIPDAPNVVSDPTTLPVIDKFADERRSRFPTLQISTVTDGSWFVAFTGPNAGRHSECWGGVYPDLAEIHKMVRLFDGVMGHVIRTLKINFGGRMMDRKLYLYLTGTGIGLPDDRCGGSPDSPFGYFGDARLGVIGHELGHSFLFPRSLEDGFESMFDDDYGANQSIREKKFSPVMSGENFGNLFGWYVFCIMMQKFPDHEFFRTRASMYATQIINPYGVLAGFFVNTHLAMDGGIYTTFHNEELNRLLNALREHIVRDRLNHFPSKLALIEGIEKIYGTRYLNGWWAMWIFRKYGAKGMVALFYYMSRHMDVVVAMAETLGIDVPTLLQIYALDTITQLCFEGEGSFDLYRPESRAKKPYPFTMQRNRMSKLFRDYPMEYKGFVVHEAREILGEYGRDSLRIAWEMDRPSEWKIVIYHGYGRGGRFHISPNEVVSLSETAGSHAFVDADVGYIDVINPTAGVPIYFAMIATSKPASGYVVNEPRISVRKI